jgi:Family of unknown function (DUF5946)
MIHKCPQCGADLPPDEPCQHRFDLCMALEYENPTTFGAVHHLTVACYMLQHNAYSRDGWLGARNIIARFIHDGVTPGKIRQQNHSRFDSGHRTWSVTKGAKFSEFDTIVWTRSIADVRYADPEVYCADVKLWATSVLTDTETLLGKLVRPRQSLKAHFKSKRG